MCRHVLNAQVYLQCRSCSKWFECAECHDERSAHCFVRRSELRMCCKACRRVFTHDLDHNSSGSERCPYCGNAWSVPAETPNSLLFAEAGAAIEQLIADLVSVDTVVHHQPT